MRNQLFQRANFLKGLPWAIICLGVILRLRQYLFNRSLWLDESVPALNIVNRSFAELLQPLKRPPTAPIGFLFLERFAVRVFGNSEYALRLFPFLFGIVSLFVFYKVAKEYIKPGAVLIALGLFAISGWMVYYSSELKQYSGDVIIALLLYLAAVYIQSKKLSICCFLLRKEHNDLSV